MLPYYETPARPYKNRSRPSNGPRFQRRHYEDIAGVLRQLPPNRMTVDAFADMLAQDNPNFDRSKFIQAATIKI